MGHWIKHFSDGTREKGTDLAVKLKTASWSKGRLDGMCGALIWHIDKTIEIIGDGEYWQSDSYESVFPTMKSTLLQRRIQKKIEVSDKSFSVSSNSNLLQVGFNGSVAGKAYKINRTMIGQWLVVELDIRTKRFRHYISGGKV